MSLPARNPRLMSLGDLKQLISHGEIDTVVIAFTDMQGRLQGKRLHASYFADVVVDQGAEGCNYLLGVDVDMNTVDGYAMTSWEKGYGDMEFVLDYDTIRRLPHLPATVLIQCDLVLDRPRAGRAVAAHDPQEAARTGRRSGVRRAGRHRAGVHPVRRDLRERLEQPLPGPGPQQPVQRRLLHPGHDARGAGAA